MCFIYQIFSLTIVGVKTPPRCTLRPPINSHIATLAKNFGELSIHSPILCPSSHLVQHPILGEFSALNAEEDNSIFSSSQMHNSTPNSQSSSPESEPTFVEATSDPDSVHLNEAHIHRTSDRIRMKCKMGTCTHHECTVSRNDAAHRLTNAEPWQGFWAK